MNDFLASRRHWLVTAASLTTGLFVSRAGIALGEAKPTVAGPVSLTVDASKSLFRVRVELDVEGNVNVPRNALVSKEKASQYPLKATSVLDWEERIIGFQSDRTIAAAERFFYEAQGEGKSGNSSRKLQLRKESQYVLVRRAEDKWVTYSPDTYLSGAELELLELPANSLAVDGMLPQVPVSPGDTYKPEKTILAKLLSLASVEDSDVVGEVDSIDDSTAKLHFTGKVQGSVAGVPTTIDLVGKMVFDRLTQTTSWLALAVREQREIGKAGPGFEVAATIKMIRKPLEVPARLSSIPPSSPNGAIDNERLYCELTSTSVGFTALMDRRWKIMSDAAGATMMRMIENDRGIGQCDLRPAGKMAAGTQLTMAALVADIKQSLGNRFGQLLESREDVNEFGLRVLKVATQGAVEGVPVQWIFLHFSDDHGRRLLATMTVAGSDLDAFAGADLQLAGSLRFITTDDESMAMANQPGKAAVK